MDPKEPGGLHVIGRNDVTLGVVDGIYFRHYGVGYDPAGRSAGKAASPGGRTRGLGRTMLHKCAVSPANQMR